MIVNPNNTDDGARSPTSNIPADTNSTIQIRARKAYPPSPFRLFFQDHVHQWRLMQQEKIRQVDSARDASPPNDDSIFVQGASTSQQVATLPQRKFQRAPSNFVIQVNKASQKWQQLSMDEKKIWEQRALVTSAEKSSQ